MFGSLSEQAYCFAFSYLLYLLTSALHFAKVKYMKKGITLSSKHQVVIPSSVRARLGLKGGDRLVITQITDKEVTLRKEPTYHDLIGALPSQKRDATQRVRNLRNQWQ